MAPSEETECENISDLNSFTEFTNNRLPIPLLRDLPQILPYTTPPEFPTPPNLKDLLRDATGSNNLEGVAEVKLKVIAQDVGLQHLSSFMPVLRELTLDGSLISSLRDLGCGLKTLKILKVNQCGLTSLDGVYGVKNLEKLYAAKNLIRDIIPCTSLESIELIDVTRNEMQDINTLTFLTLCEKLEHLILSRNPKICDIDGYRSKVKSLLPNLKTLDNIEYEEYLQMLENNGAQGKEQRTTSAISMNCTLPPIATKKESNEKKDAVGEDAYSVSFSPRVLSPLTDGDVRASTSNIKVHKVELPKI